MCHRYTTFMRHHYKFQLSEFLFQICHPQICFQSLLLFLDMFRTKLDSQAWDFLSHNILAQQEINLPYGFTTFPYPRLFLAAIIPQLIKLLFLMHIHFYRTFQLHQNNFRIVHTNNQIHFLKRKYHSS
jgi:hypothetical protein